MTADTAGQMAPVRTSLDIGAAIAGRGLRAVLWKSNGHLAQALAARTDLDIFADPQEREALQSCFREVGCIHVWSQLWASYPDVEDWLAVDPGTGRILHLHVHFALVTGLRRVKHLRLPWSEALLANSDHALTDAWLTPTAEMELMILLVRMWAKMPPKRRLLGPRLPSDVREEFDWLRARCDAEELRRLAAQLLPGFDASRITALLAGQPAEQEVLSVSRSAYATLKGGYRQNWALALLRSTLLNLRAAAAKTLRKIRPATVTGKRIDGPGLVVAFIGSDGSGKSTVTREICHWLRYKLDVHFYYMGSGDGSTRLTDRLRRTIKSTGGKKKRETGASAVEQGPKQRGFFTRLLNVYRLDEIRGKLKALKQAHRLAAQGSIAVLDRLPQMQVPGLSDGPRMQQGNSFAWAARAELKLFSEVASLPPDLVVKLIVSPEVAHARKPDHNIEKMRRKAEITEALAFPCRIVEIDANQPLDEVILQVKRAVWEAIRARVAGAGHG